MKILLATPINQASGDPHLFWLKALVQLGHRVKLFRLNCFPQFKLFKSWQLKQTIAHLQPESIFFSAGKDAVFPIKNTIFFSGVAPKTLSRSERQMGIQAQLVAVNDPSHITLWEKLGAKKTICLPISAIDPDFFKLKKLKRTISVSFIGTLFPYRQEILAKIAQLYPEVKIWGRLEPGVKLMKQLQPFYQGVAEGKKLVKIYQQSLIGLNLAPTHLPHAGNLRCFEIPGCHALLLSNRLNLAWFIPNQEAVIFSTPQDCVKKIKYYLNHKAQRERLAHCGYQRTITDHTYKNRFKQLINQL